MQPVNFEDAGVINSTENIILYNGKHCVYASEGFYDEQVLNQPVELEKFNIVYGGKTLGKIKYPVKGAYQLG